LLAGRANVSYKRRSFARPSKRFFDLARRHLRRLQGRRLLIIASDKVRSGRTNCGVDLQDSDSLIALGTGVVAIPDGRLQMDG